MRPYVAEVESSVKGGISVKLGRLTLIHGRAGTRKTAIVQALGLGLAARASDVGGKASVAKEIDLMALAPGRTAQLFSKIRLSDGAEGIFSVEFKPAKGKTKAGTKNRVHTPPVGVDPTHAIPLDDLREALLGKPDTARRFFVDRLVGGVSDQDVLARIPPQLHDRFLKATAACKVNDPAIDKLLAALEKAKELKSDATGAAKGAGAAVQSTTQGLPPNPTEMEITEAQVAFDAVKAELEEAVATEVKAQSAVAMFQTYQQLAAQRDLAIKINAENETKRSAELTRRQAALAAWNDLAMQVQNAEGYRRQVEGWLASQGVAGPTDFDRALAIVLQAAADACGMTTDEAMVPVFVAGAQAPAGYVRAHLAQLQAQFAASAQAGEARRQAEGEVARTVAYLTQARAQMDHAKAAIDVIDAVLGAIPPPQPVPVVPDQPPAAPGDGIKVDVAGIRAKLRIAESTVQQLLSIRGMWASSDRARDNAVESDAEALGWNQLIDAIDGALGVFLDRSVAAFTAKVQTRLPPSDRFALQLREGGREVFQCGLVAADGTLHTSLSGSEQARVWGAMADVVSEGVKGPVLVTLPDASIHPEDLAQMMEAFAKGPFDGQVVLTSGVAPSRPINGWTVIDSAAGTHVRSIATPVASAATVTRPSPRRDVVTTPQPTRMSMEEFAAQLRSTTATPASSVSSPQPAIQQWTPPPAPTPARSEAADAAAVADPKYNGLACSVCGEMQFVSPGGDTCKNGHGGSPGTPIKWTPAMPTDVVLAAPSAPAEAQTTGAGFAVWPPGAMVTS